MDDDAMARRLEQQTLLLEKVAHEHLADPKAKLSADERIDLEIAARNLTRAVRALVDRSNQAHEIISDVIALVAQIASCAIYSDSLAAVITKDAARLAGKRSGETRARKAQASWQTHALERALESRRADPSKSQDDVATDIAHSWRDPMVRCPSHRTVKAFVAGCIKRGVLPEKIRQRTVRVAKRTVQWD